MPNSQTSEARSASASEAVYRPSANGGTLHLDFRPILNVRLRLRPWEHHCVLERWEEGRWQPELLDPAIQLVPASTVTPPLVPSHVAQYCEHIPAPVLNAISAYRAFQVTQLGLAARHGPAFVDIMTSAPNLAWVIAGLQQELGIDSQRMASLLSGRRRALLESFIPGASRSTLRVLNKIDVIKGDLAEFRLVLRALYQTGWQDRLRHWQRIPIEALYLLRRHPSALETRFLEAAQEAESARRLDSASGVFRGMRRFRADAMQLAARLAIGNARQLLDQCRTPTELRNLHDRWTQRLNTRLLSGWAPDKESIPLPEPPLPGTPSIVPISDLAALETEGIVMRHCAAGYAQRVYAGETYLYRVLEPERATLSLVRRGGSWSLGELKLSGNRAPSEETRATVSEWLNRYAR